MWERLQLREEAAEESASRPKWRRPGFVAAAVALVVIALSATLAGLMSRHGHSHRPGYSRPDIAVVISEKAVFPNGSFFINASAVRVGPLDMAPTQPNATTLTNLGIKINDQDYSLAEAGRLSYFYIRVTNSTILSDRMENWAGEALKKQNYIKVSSIGIRFGDAEKINIVPLFVANEIGSGLRQIKIPKDSTTLYELQVRMPDTLCLQQDDGCHFTSWSVFACARDNETCVSGEMPSSLAIPCGNQCVYPSTSFCATTGCRRCGDEQSTGGDGPASRRYSFGTTRGVVELRYATGIAKNRITVRYEGNILFDSGCATTVENWDSVAVRFAGNSKELRVDVEPNCDSGVRAEWSFNVSCLYPCGYNSNKAVLIYGSATEVIPRSRVSITKEANMPLLTAYYCPGDKSEVDIRWRLTVNTTRGKPDRCRPNVKEGWRPRWNATPLVTQGGDATLLWNVGNGTTVGSLKFKIIGNNPDARRVVAEIRNRTDLWYAGYVAQRESGHKQFGGDGYPLMGANGGYGVFPLANPLPTCTQVWSWKHNVKIGVIRLEQRATNGRDQMAFSRRLAREHTGSDQFVPVRREANCVFQDDTERVIEDAVALKEYHGNTTVDYCFWNWTSNEWVFQPLDGMGFNYVESLCQLVPP